MDVLPAVAPPVVHERPPATRWLALVVLLGLGLVAVGGIAMVRRSRAESDSRAALAALAPGPVVGGSGLAYAHTWVGADGRPARWNPCRPIRWVSSSRGAPGGAVAEVQVAVDRLRAATGIEFDYLGETTESPSVGRADQSDRYGAGWSPLLVAWAPLSGTALGAGLGVQDSTVGVATPVVVTRPGSQPVIVTAQVVLETRRPLPPGFRTSRSSGAVVLHELAHALGLAHVSDPSQLMYDGDAGYDGPGELQRGDLAGLAALGREAGCLDQPEPGSAARAR